MSVEYRELYEEGRRILEGVPLPDASLDARLLLEEVCGTDLQTLLVYPETPVSEQNVQKYRALIERRRLREPTAMILGSWDFMGLTFRVTKDTLIPEQDTEVLVETVLQLIAGDRHHAGTVTSAPLFFRENTIRPAGSGAAEDFDAQRCDAAGLQGPPGKGPGGRDLRGEGLRILDLCTGSGCILLSLLHFLPGASGIGTDLSPGALAVAEENARSLGLDGRAVFLQGDLWKALRNPEERFDLIVSNPPYVPTAVIETLEPEVRCGEPFAALDGGADGLEFYRRILGEAGDHLKNSGILAVESGFDEAEDIRAMMASVGWASVGTVKDYGGLDRVVYGRWAGEPLRGCTGGKNVRENGIGSDALRGN